MSFILLHTLNIQACCLMLSLSRQLPMLKGSNCLLLQGQAVCSTVIPELHDPPDEGTTILQNARNYLPNSTHHIQHDVNLQRHFRNDLKSRSYPLCSHEI